MKNIKKFLSVVLTIAMLCSFATVFANDLVLSDIDYSTLTGKAVKELTNYNIINGYEDGTFRPDNTITRAEIAKIIVAFLNLSNIGADNLASGFADVDSVDHWSKKYVRIAADKGIIVGYEDGTFKPDNPVKYSEVVKMVVCALNYGSIAVQRTSADAVWYAGYVSVAAEKGILNGASINNQEDPASRGNVAILIYNALDVVPAIEKVDSSGQISVSVDDNGKTAREDFLASEKIEGIVTAVGQTSLSEANSGLTARYIKIDDGKDEVTYKVPLNTDAYSLLGYKISADIRTDTFDDYYSITNIAKDSKNKTTVISPEDIDSISLTKINYWPSDTATKKSSITIENDASFIYNGRYYNAITEADFDIKSGEITLLDNDNDGRAEVVFVDSYKVVAVKSSATDSSTGLKKIYGLYGEGDIIVPDTAKYLSINNKGTEVTDPTKLSVSKFDIINLRQSKDNEVFDMIITKNKVSGEITTKNSDGSYMEIENNGDIKGYNIEYNFMEYTGTDKPALLTGDKITAYTDKFGNIAAAETSALSGDTLVNAGFLVNALKESGIGGIAQVQVYGLSGATGKRIFTLNDKVKIDGVSYSDYSQMLSALESSSDVANEDKGSLDGIIVGKYSQLIKYTLNSKGYVDTIDTVVPNTSVSNDDLALSLAFPNSPNRYDDGGYKYQNGVNTFIDTNSSTVIKLSSTNKILSLPKDLSDIDSYSMKSNGSFSTNKTYCVEAYNLNNVAQASYILVYNGFTGSSSFGDDSPVVITKTVSSVASADKLTGWNFLTNAEVTNLLSDTAGLFTNGLSTGDIFRYTVDGDNKVDKIEVLVDYNNGSINLFPDKGSNALLPKSSATDANNARKIKYDSRSAIESQCTLIYGTVLDMDEDTNVLSVTTSVATDTFVNSIADLKTGIKDTYNCSSAKYYVLDTKATDSNKIITSDSSMAEITTLETIANENEIENASQVLMYYWGGIIKSVIIIK